MDIKKFESELRDILEQAQLGEIEKAIDRACSGGKNHEALTKTVNNIIYPLFNQATEEKIRELTIKYLEESKEDITNCTKEIEDGVVVEYWD